MRQKSILFIPIVHSQIVFLIGIVFLNLATLQMTFIDSA